MGKTIFDKFLSILLVVLVIAVLSGIGYLVYKYYEKYKINTDAENFCDNEFEQYIEAQKNDDNSSNDDNQNENDENEHDEQGAIEEQTQGNSVQRGIETNSLKYKNYAVEGKIEMPSVNLRYPVLELLKDMNELEASIAIQYGVGLNKVGNTILVGHNYRSGLFFGSNKNMNIGDSIYITDTATGKRIEYKIYNKYTTEESDTSYFYRNTNGKREVTLVTCQANNKYRLVIFAREV